MIDLHYHQGLQRLAMILPLAAILACAVLDWQIAFATVLLVAAGFELALLLRLHADVVPPEQARDRYERLSRIIRRLAPPGDDGTQEQRVVVYTSTAPRVFVRGLRRRRLYCTTALLAQAGDGELRGMVALALGWTQRLHDAPPATQPAEALDRPEPHPILQRPAWWGVIDSERDLPDDRHGPERRLG